MTSVRRHAPARPSAQRRPLGAVSQGSPITSPTRKEDRPAGRDVEELRWGRLDLPELDEDAARVVRVVRPGERDAGRERDGAAVRDLDLHCAKVRSWSMPAGERCLYHSWGTMTSVSHERARKKHFSTHKLSAHDRTGNVKTENLYVTTNMSNVRPWTTVRLAHLVAKDVLAVLKACRDGNAVVRWHLMEDILAPRHRRTVRVVYMSWCSASHVVGRDKEH
jgi:hypothetical protein